MECFVIIVKGWKLLTIITKHSILDVAAVNYYHKHSILDVAAALNPPLIPELNTVVLNSEFSNSVMFLGHFE